MTKPTIILSTTKGIVPHHYRMVYYRHQCKRCGSMHSHDEIYAMVAIAGGYRGIPCHNMSDLEYNLPVEVKTANLTTTPFCHMCFNPDIMRGLPKAPAPTKIVGGPRDEPKTEKPKAAKGPKTYTVDDLDID